jgi:RNA polymerase sigma-70 factor, ECF subfamily
MTLTPVAPSDDALMRKVQAGSRVALGELYVRFAPPAYRTAISVCRDRDCAQDAVQDAFLSIWLSRSTYRSERGAVSHWAMAIVRNRAIYLARRRSVGRGLTDETARLEEQAGDEDVSSDLDSRVDAEQLEQMLAQLPRAQQQVIQLAFFDDLTHGEIASRLALPPGTVKGRMRLGLRKLRAGLQGSDPIAPKRTSPRRERASSARREHSSSAKESARTVRCVLSESATRGDTECRQHRQCNRVVQPRPARGAEGESIVIRGAGSGKASSF